MKISFKTDPICRHIFQIKWVLYWKLQQPHNLSSVDPMRFSYPRVCYLDPGFYGLVLFFFLYSDVANDEGKTHTFRISLTYF